MTATPKAHTWRETAVELLLPVIIALVFLAFTFFFYPFRGKIQFDSDEGLNLMRSMLVVKGYPLYLQVSSDQPPLFTHLLGLVMRLAGFSVTPARLFVLLFSGVLVWSCAQFLQLAWGRLAALLFLPLAIITPRYLVLSVSVMIGLPSIALAFVSLLCLAIWHYKRRDRWLVLSGFVLALSVLIKLFTGFLAPIFVAGMTLSLFMESRKTGLSWKVLKPALVWCLSFGGLALVLGLILIGPQNVPLIIAPHLNATAQAGFEGDYYQINTYLQPALPLLGLALFGVYFTIRRRNWLSFYLLAWVGVAYIFLSLYTAVHYHHQLLVTLPAGLLAAAGVAEALLEIRRAGLPAGFFRPAGLLGLVAALGFALVTVSYAPAVKDELDNSPQTGDPTLVATAGKLKVIHLMNEYAPQTNWILTDMPMYAYIVGKPVPPVLATFSRKRLATGALTDAEVLAAAQQYHPEQVLMARFVIPSLENYLSRNYTLVASPEDFRLFIRNDLVKTKP